jgi:hypothetical protein
MPSHNGTCNGDEPCDCEFCTRKENTTIKDLGNGVSEVSIEVKVDKIYGEVATDTPLGGSVKMSFQVPTSLVNTQVLGEDPTAEGNKHVDAELMELIVPFMVLTQGSYLMGKKGEIDRGNLAATLKTMKNAILNNQSMIMLAFPLTDMKKLNVTNIPSKDELHVMASAGAAQISTAASLLAQEYKEAVTIVEFPMSRAQELINIIEGVKEASIFQKEDQSDDMSYV